MLIRKFEGESLEKILATVKRELGPKALVLSTEQKKKSIFLKPMVEVTAAVLPDTESSFSDDGYDLEKLTQMFPHRRKKEEAPPPVSSERRYIDIEEGTKSTFSAKTIENSFRKHGFSETVSQDLTRQVLMDFTKKELEEPANLLRAQMKVLDSKINFVPLSEIKNRRWLILGSEGAGKTAAMVKLGFHLKEEKQAFAMRILQNRRVFAKKEIHHLSKLMQVPFETRSSTELWESSQIDSVPNGFDTCLWVVDGRVRLEELCEEAQLIKKSTLIDGVVITRGDKISQRGKVWELLKKLKIPLVGINFSNSYETPLISFNSKSFLKYLLNVS